MAYQTYDIGGKRFYQRPCGAMQEALVEELVIEEFTQADGVKDLPSFLRMLGPRKPKLMAVVLIPEGMDRNDFMKELERPDYLERQAAWLADESSPGVRMKVVADFFVCNDIALYAEGMLDLIQAAMQVAKQADGLPLGNGLKSVAPSSPMATPEAVAPSMP